MGQNLFINFDSETLTNSRCRAADDLRSKKFSPFVAGDSLVFDLFLTGTEGLLNIQDYPVVRMGVGDLNARPESGTYEVGGFSLDYNHSAAELEATIESATGNGCTVVELAPFVFKVSFDAVGAQTVPAIDSSDLTPRSTVDRQTLQLGDATTKEIWLWRLYANPVAFTDAFTNIAGDGVRGTIPLSTAGIYDLLGDATSVKTFFEIELTDSLGDIITVLQTRIDLTGEVIGEGFAGYIPAPTPLSGDIQAFLASADYAAARNNLLDTDSVIWCNDGDNIQDKYDEAAALTPNGNPLSATNLASLIVTSGTYGNIYTPSDLFVNIIGIGTVTVGSLSLDGASALNYATIDNLTITSGYEDAGNYGVIKNIICGNLSSFVENFGLIQNVKCSSNFYMETNSGIIDGCDGGTNSRSFGGDLGSINNGTIKNCTAAGNGSFGQQGADGVTENCTAGLYAFASNSNKIVWGATSGVYGTYKNCTAGDQSFFARNTDQNVTRDMNATYIGCKAGDKSFGFLNSSLSSTNFKGKAINCEAGIQSFVAAINGTGTIEAGAIIEKCTAGDNSFGKLNSSNEGAVLRCRGGQFSFNATGTGVVRLCLDENYDIVNIPATAWPT